MRWLLVVILMLGAVAGCADSEGNEEADPTATSAGVETTDSTPEADEPTVMAEATEALPDKATPTVEITLTAEATPTAEPTPTIEPTPTTEPEPETPGTGRSNPIPTGESGQTPDGNWQVRVNEVLRGDAAWQRIVEANQFNEPAREGMEYVLANVMVVYTGTASEAQTVSRFEFSSTGDARVRWGWSPVVVPQPELRGELFSGGEVTGWVSLYARAGETNLMTIFEPPFSIEEGDEIFLALDQGATVAPIVERSADANDIGTSRDAPAPLGEHVINDVWEVWVIEVVRGEAALTMTQEANQFNEAPAEGVEYVLVRIGARNVKAEHGSDSIGRINFQTTGASNVVHDPAAIVSSQPELQFNVYAGGEVEGWVPLQAQAGEGNLLLVFNSALFGGETRYLALQ